MSTAVLRDFARLSLHRCIKPPSGSAHIRSSGKSYTSCTRSRFMHSEFSTETLSRSQPKPGSRGGLPVSNIFSVLAIIGIGTTAYGICDFYASFALWPRELREDLRPGIKAQHQGDLGLSERYLRRAWQTSLTLPKESLGYHPWLKISGIACKLGEVLETAELPHKAYDIYAECCALMQASAARDELSLPERHRAVVLAMHLGALADQLGKKEEEEWLLWSVEEFIRIFKSNSGDNALRHLDKPEATELTLPTWTQNDEFEAALEALGSCYAKQGNTELALPLYLRALSIILPPDSPQARADAAPQRRCRAAQLMTNISGLLIRDDPSPERFAQARMWTIKGLEIAEKARADLSQGRSPAEPECERVLAVLLYNMGAVLEMQDDREAAKAHFERALKHSQSIGMREGVLEADDALARLSITKGS